MPDDFESCGHVLQHLRNVFTEFAQAAAARRTAFLLWFVNRYFTGKVIRQRTAYRLACCRREDRSRRNRAMINRRRSTSASCEDICACCLITMSFSAAASSVFRSGSGATGIFKLCHAFSASSADHSNILMCLCSAASDRHLGLPGAGWLPPIDAFQQHG